MEHRTVRQYSLCFKRQVIDDLESGRFGSIDAARRHYGIRGRGTIQIWLRKYGKNHLLPKVVIVQKPDEKDQIRELKRQVAELQRVLGQTQAQNVLNGELLVPEILTAADQMLADLQAASDQIPRREYHAEAQPLTKMLDKTRTARTRGPQLIGEVLPLVLAKLGLERVQSASSGGQDPS